MCEQRSLLRAPGPGRGHAGPGAAAMAAAEGGKRAGKGGRKGREKRGRGAGQPAPRRTRAGTSSPTSCTAGKHAGSRGGRTRGIQEGLTVPSTAEKPGERRRCKGEGSGRARAGRTRRRPPGQERRRDCSPVTLAGGKPASTARSASRTQAEKAGPSGERPISGAAADCAPNQGRWSWRWSPCGRRGPGPGAPLRPSRCRRAERVTSRARCG